MTECHKRSTFLLKHVLLEYLTNPTSLTVFAGCK